MNAAYRSLDPGHIIATVEALNRRIDERFPGSGLGMICSELGDIARESVAKASWIAQPNMPLRLGVGFLVLLGLVALGYSVSLLNISLQSFHFGELLQVVDAGLNNLIFIAVAIFFLFTLEARIKRARAMEALHELRTIVHVIDMHQLTKDPTKGEHTKTASSPERSLTAFELTRYLDYCSEMFSLTGKIAALYAQDFRDSAVLAAVNDIESLTTGLSRKVWQKIMIVKDIHTQR